MKLKPTYGGYQFYCPGCHEYHTIDYRWRITGDLTVAPTVRPSIVRKTGMYADPTWEGVGSQLCHCLITGGVIQFSPDTSHGLSGMVVPLPEI
jgi:hypothetical protein